MTKKAVQRHGFRTGESIVYPSHGVGKIVDIEEQVVAGMKMELFVINFPKDKMTRACRWPRPASVRRRSSLTRPGRYGVLDGAGAAPV